MLTDFRTLATLCQILHGLLKAYRRVTLEFLASKLFISSKVRSPSPTVCVVRFIGFQAFLTSLH